MARTPSTSCRGFFMAQFPSSSPPTQRLVLDGGHGGIWRLVRPHGVDRAITAHANAVIRNSRLTNVRTVADVHLPPARMLIALPAIPVKVAIEIVACRSISILARLKACAIHDLPYLALQRCQHSSKRVQIKIAASRDSL